eukprot:370207_1
MELTIFQYSSLLYVSFAGDVKQSSECGKEIMNVCFDLSLFLTQPNESISQNESNNYIQSLAEIIDPNIAKIITSFVVNASNYLKWVQFKNMDNNKFHMFQTQVNYSFNDHIVDFGHAARDYLNIPTQLLSQKNFSKYYINIYCFDKGDEMWLGLIEQHAYTPTFNARCHKHGLFYYGGRQYSSKRYGGRIKDKCCGWKPVRNIQPTDCNHGSIQGTGHLISHPLESYSGGDWINFEIDFINKTMTVYKNGKHTYLIEDTYFPNGDCYFIVEVDATRDKFYIEQAYHKQCN